jgi:predicted PurR-regulated permease PerM
MNGADGRSGSRDWLTPVRLASLVAVIAAAYALLTVLRALRPLLLMLLVSLFLSFAMEPAVQFLARRGWKRGAATGAVFLAVGAGLIAFFAAMAPLFYSQVVELLRNVPTIVDRLGTVAENTPLPVDLQTSPETRSELATLTVQLRERLEGIALGAAGRVVDVGATALSGILQSFTILLVTFYLVADGPRARQVLFRPFPPDRQRELLAVWELAVAKTGGYIYSRLLLAFIAAVATGLFLMFAGIPAAIPLAAWVGVTSAFVPVVGTYLGGVLPVVVAIASARPERAIWVVSFIVVYQQIENYLLAPRIQSHTMEVHPAVAFVSVLAGGYLLGAVGALLALPAAAIIQALLSTYVSRHELITELHEMQLPSEPAPRTTLEDLLRRRRERRIGRGRRSREGESAAGAASGVDTTARDAGTEEHV